MAKTPTKILGAVSGYQVSQLTKELAERYIQKILALVNLIPLIHHTAEEVLADKKMERILYAKWDHSLVIFDKDTPMGVLIAYERASENNDQYPYNSININELVIGPTYRNQGLGKNLLSFFFNWSSQVGMVKLDGKLRYSIQTNSDPSNLYVQKLYESFGFKKRTTKTYVNRIDYIYGLDT
mgnify:FL=1